MHVDVGEPTALVIDVPNRFGPGSVAYDAGMPVHCVCSIDAVRVLARSAAAVSNDPASTLVAESVEALSAT